jgi:hypothetical protein
MEQSVSSETNNSPGSERNYQYFMEAEGLLPSLEDSATCIFPEVEEFSSRLSHLHLGLPSLLFPSAFPTFCLSPIGTA